ncbi:MAG TPA: MopE-related protein [Saprospiraceae bacterium]|nr:MopE-related protein [Saprospiraceae bacterium]HMQ84514.1 MopE-related protein [Saprospiraceae bacterium]
MKTILPVPKLNVHLFYYPIILVFACNLCFSTLAIGQHSIAREWNEVLLSAIRKDFARPTVHARNLWHTSAAMYDAWAVYDDDAVPYLLGNTVGGFECPFDGIAPPADPEQAQRIAICFAAYRMIAHRFQNSPGYTTTIGLANSLMLQQGLSVSFTSTDYSTGNPAALGNYIAQCMINFGLQDGANELGNYQNQYYQPVNTPLIMDLPGNPDILDFNRWQPLTLEIFIDQSGNVIPGATPPFLSPEWGNVTPFALTEEDRTVYMRDGHEYLVYHDPGLPPLLDTVDGGGTSDFYKWGFALVATWSSHLSPDDGVMWDISPASIGNIQEYPNDPSEYADFYDILNGGDASVGHALNPHTGLPYEPQLVRRGDYARILAEFWADGPDSETPPGHWFTILNYVSDHPELEKRFKGEGPILDDLEWDIKSYFVLGGAMHDVAVTAWGIKGWYDYIRPVSAIRGMAELGQSSDPNAISYHPGGIPLFPGYIELILPGDPLQGSLGQHIGKIKMRVWKGPDFITNPDNDVAGVGWIRAEMWWPYQRPSFVTPPFAGYISGHSTYSRAAAEVMTLLTGDPFFPGGMGEFPAPMNEFLVFEEGPSMDITLQWATYQDASDQCSLSRIWGGIHPPADDIPGRHIGSIIGPEAFALAERFFFRDEDMDGFSINDDCDDNDATVYPGAPEVCDGKDNNCDTFVDEGLPIFTYFRDADNDSFGDGGVPLDTCLATPPAGFVTNGLDCNDNDSAIHPNADEVCDDIDNNCNGLLNDGIAVSTYYRDADNDSFGDGGVPLDTCLAAPPVGYVTNDLDCNDNDSAIHPNAAEVCDDIDNNCNGLLNDGIAVSTYYRDADNDNFGDGGVPLDTCLAAPPSGYVTNDLDCNDNDSAIHPNAAEVCDGIDNNCNGLINDGLTLYAYYRDSDGDGFGNIQLRIDTCASDAPVGYVLNDMDCDDGAAAVFPGAPEICDGIDNDCANGIDDGLIFLTYYEDRDGDGFGDLNSTSESCVGAAPIGFVTDNTDCDDNDANRYPSASEIPDNGVDEDCSGVDLFIAPKVFPNPARNEVYVHLDYTGMLNYRWISADGRIAREGRLEMQANSTTLDVATLHPGVYFLQLLDLSNEQLLLERVLVY